MAAKILTAIPDSVFERVRNQIGIILLEELTNQKVLQPLVIPYDFTVTKESLIPTDESDAVNVNILLDSASYTSSTQKDAEGITRYFLDISTSGEETSTKAGSIISSERRDKFINMIGFIFRSAIYRTLGLPAGTIGNTTVESFATLDPYKKEDSSFTTFARVILSVKIYESSVAWTSVDLIGNNTTVKLELSNKGYKFVLNS